MSCQPNAAERALISSSLVHCFVGLGCPRFQLAAHIRKLGTRPTKAQRLKAYKKRDRLQCKIDAFHKRAAAYWLKDAAFEEDLVDYGPEPDDDASDADGDNIYVPPH